MRSLLGATVATTVNIPVAIITTTAATSTTANTTNAAISGLISACFNRFAPLIIGCL